MWVDVIDARLAISGVVYIYGGGLFELRYLRSSCIQTACLPWRRRLNDPGLLTTRVQLIMTVVLLAGDANGW